MAPIDLSEQRLDAYIEQGVDRVVLAATGDNLDRQRAELSAFAERHL